MIETLERAARECGALVLEIRSSGLKTKDKDDHFGSHFLTQADLASQERGIRIIRERFPDEVIIAEEQENDPTVPLDCVVFDPLDGTTVYFNGGQDFAVILCALRGGQPQAGVIYFPVDGMLVSAVRGQGCFVNGERIVLSHRKPLDKTLLGADVASWTVYEVLEPLSRRFGIRSLMVGVAGAREVLLGVTGMYYSLNSGKVWDAAAATLAVQEAGGVACAPDGSPLRWDSIDADWVLAANQELADCVLAETRRWPGRGK